MDSLIQKQAKLSAIEKKLNRIKIRLDEIKEQRDIETTLKNQFDNL